MTWFLTRLHAFWATFMIWRELHGRGFAEMTADYLNQPSSTPAAAEQHRLSARANLLAASALAPWSTCLTRSIALLRFARDIGVKGTLRIAPTAAGDRFAAHAWVVFGAWTTENGAPKQWLQTHDR